MKDYFGILGLDKNASEEQIRKAYKALAKIYHPDVNKFPDAHNRFIEITEAYEYLIQQKTVRPEEPDLNKEEYEQFIRDIRERAQRQARMRYEEFQKQHEAFRQSGLNDVVLLSLLILRITLLPLFATLLLLPLVLAFIFDWKILFLILIFWPIAFIVWLYIKEKWKTFLQLGELYYTPKKILEIFKQRNISTQQCYFSSGKIADSRPYKIELLKLKDLKLKSEGFRQHQAQYINEKVILFIPRSHKALIVHSLQMGVKLASILGCIVFLDISSVMWRFIFGFAVGGLLSFFISTITHTRSCVSHLYNISFLLRVCIWILAICRVSFFYFTPFNVYTSGYIQLIVTIIIVADCFLMQAINAVFGKFAYKMIRKQNFLLKEKLDQGYKIYNDVPVISVIYPLYKWIFG